MRFLNEIKNRQLTSELICEIHSKLVQNTIEEKYLGCFRDNDEVKVIESATGEVAHSPPKHIEIPVLIEALCGFMNAEQRTFLHPIIKAIILHFMIGYIHPFQDGNGRTARALFYWYALKSGYWLFEYMPISMIIKRAPAKYSHAYVYAENDDNDLTYFVVFHLDRLEMALKEFIQYVGEKQNEAARVKEILKNDSRLKFRQSDIILRFMKHPRKRFTINEIKQIYNVTYETARTDLEVLAQFGYCDLLKEGRRFVYIFSSKTQKTGKIF
jgi:Fic family protein